MKFYLDFLCKFVNRLWRKQCHPVIGISLKVASKRCVFTYVLSPHLGTSHKRSRARASMKAKCLSKRYQSHKRGGYNTNLVCELSLPLFVFPGTSRRSPAQLRSNHDHVATGTVRANWPRLTFSYNSVASKASPHPRYLQSPLERLHLEWLHFQKLSLHSRRK